MALVNYRAVQDRFTHIDAEFVHCRLEMPGECSYAVRFYPWWEHPAYLAARQAKQNWGFTPQSQEGAITVTVYPRGLREFSISQQTEVTDWDFSEMHPLLWGYEQDERITCNSPLTLDQALALVDLVRKETQGQVNPFQYLNCWGGFMQFLGWAQQGSFSLGIFPRPLYLKVRDYLTSIGAKVYEDTKFHYSKAAPKILLIDSDYIIADDFDVDVPDIIHKPEWFAPASPHA